mmetsp:Transcript_20909/g.48893  ORF Transcript_20909/g.48893 Transcript_20909/m.48893 type:complete len:217 (+) Transcript_20909:2711-3361(+)
MAGWLTEKRARAVPTWRTVLTATVLVAPAPMLRRAITEESDTHRVVATAVAPRRARSDRSASPRLAPTTVTLDAPVTGTLEETTLETMVRANEKEAKVLATVRTEVAAMARESAAPCGMWHLRDDCDTHKVDTTPVPPMRARLVRSTAPRLVPRTVTLVAPVAGVFLDTVRVARLKVKELDSEATVFTTVTELWRPAATEDPERAVTEVSDTQTDA